MFWVEVSRITPFHFVEQQVMDKDTYSGRCQGNVTLFPFYFLSFLWIEDIFVAGRQVSNREKISSCVCFTNKLHNYIFCPDDPSNIHTDIASISQCPVTKQKISN